MKRSEFAKGAEDILGCFYDLSQIPRQPHQCEAVTAFLLDYAAGLGLTAYRDAADNVVITKKATPGCENAAPVILAAHTDMVCETEQGCDHDFDGPLSLCREGDKLYAKGTTLGADDGIGVAAAMAILAGNGPHPPIEAVFTANEETTMSGAWGLDMSRLSGELLISLDSHAVLTCGSGEVEVEMSFPKLLQPAPEGVVFRSIQVLGLRGGHTGSDAMEEPGNAIMLLNRLLLRLAKTVDYKIADIQGGAGSSSAFARQAGCVIVYQPESDAPVTDIIHQCQEEFRAELEGRAPDLSVTNTAAERQSRVFSRETQNTLLRLLALLPDGICSLNHRYAGVMESCANCGVLEADGKEIRLTALVRSTRAGKKYQLLDKITLLCEVLGVSCTICHDIPQWDERVTEPLKALVRRVYKGKPFEIAQGTLECGIFQEKKPGLSILGLGIPYHHQHAPAEFMNVGEIQEYWLYLKQFLEELAHF